jgi:hypothetical protein
VEARGKALPLSGDFGNGGGVGRGALGLLGGN